MSGQQAPEPKDYKPAATYDLLLLQFNGLKKILAGCERRCAEYHAEWRKTMSDDATANKEDNNAIRETNERLTNDLLRLEQKCDELVADFKRITGFKNTGSDDFAEFACGIAEQAIEKAGYKL